LLSKVVVAHVSAAIALPAVAKAAVRQEALLAKADRAVVEIADLPVVAAAAANARSPMGGGGGGGRNFSNSGGGGSPTRRRWWWWRWRRRPRQGTLKSSRSIAPKV